jgi:hypothetical protein
MQAPSSSSYLAALGLQPLFTYSFNYMLLVQMVITIGAVVLLIVLRRAQHKSSSSIKLHNWYYNARKIVRIIAIYSLCNLFFSLGLNLAYFKSFSLKEDCVNLAMAIFTVALVGATRFLPAS